MAAAVADVIDPNKAIDYLVDLCTEYLDILQYPYTRRNCMDPYSYLLNSGSLDLILGFADYLERKRS